MFCCTRNCVYKATCKQTGRSYIGNTGRRFKTRFGEHLRCARRLIDIEAKHRRLQLRLLSTNPNHHPTPVHMDRRRQHHLAGLRASSTSLARFIAETHYKNYMGPQPSIESLRNLFTYKILWTGKTRACSNSFGTWDCVLCARERIELINAHKFAPDRGTCPLINQSLEIHGHCPHGSLRRFHPMTQLDGNTGADDSE